MLMSCNACPLPDDIHLNSLEGCELLHLHCSGWDVLLEFIHSTQGINTNFPGTFMNNSNWISSRWDVTGVYILLVRKMRELNILTNSSRLCIALWQWYEFHAILSELAHSDFSVQVMNQSPGGCGHCRTTRPNTWTEHVQTPSPLAVCLTLLRLMYQCNRHQGINSDTHCPSLQTITCVSTFYPLALMRIIAF